MNPSFNIDPSVTSAISLESLSASAPVTTIPSNFRAVVLGGGTGAPASIKALRSLGISTNAVVAMADDGGSTGDLRKDADVTPPGDIRKCLCAFASNPKDPFTQAFKYRFPVANNHTLGNLMLSALEDSSGSFPAAISICESLLHCDGHVLPSTLEHVYLKSETIDGTVLQGQALATKSNSALKRVFLINKSGSKPKAYEPAIKAIVSADLIVLGPGSLFTSIIPNLLVDGIIDAITESRGKVVFVCGISDVQGETWGLTASEHVKALMNHGMTNLIDYVLLNSSKSPDSFRAKSRVRFGSIEHQQQENTGAVRQYICSQSMHIIDVSPEEIAKIQALGPVAVQNDLSDPSNPSWHNLLALRSSFEQIIGMMIARRGY